MGYPLRPAVRDGGYLFVIEMPVQACYNHENKRAERVGYMGNTTFEEEIDRTGRIVYTNLGCSMMPLLRQHRDLMIIEKPAGRLKKYEVPLYKRDNGQYVLHRILKVRGQDYVICGDHCWTKEYGITDRHIIGVLTAVVRDGKTIPVTDWRYLAYVHLWCDFFYVRAAILLAKALLYRMKRKMKR
mgnify:FL=1